MSLLDEQPLKAVTGFSLIYDPSDRRLSKWKDAHQVLREDFPWLKHLDLQIGKTQIKLWGHTNPTDGVFVDQHGSTWILAGSPTNHPRKEDLLGASQKDSTNVALQIEGRWVLIRITQDGEVWDLSNDWAGAMPIFFAGTQEGGTVCSIEPLVKQICDLGASELSRRGLVELLMFGHLFGNDTLYEPMRVLSPDCISHFHKGRFKNETHLWTVKVDEQTCLPEKDLLKRLHELTVSSISSSLSTASETPILLTLSSGMDSRLIACVAGNLDHQVEAFTYGPSGWTEPHYGRKIARSLKIPWTHVPVGLDYLRDFTHRWLRWFGTSLHAHGMYQFPFLERVHPKNGVIPNGYFGNNMAGGDHPNDCLFESGKSLVERFCGYGTVWTQASLKELLTFDPESSLAEINDLLSTQEGIVKDWPIYQRMNCLDMWNRQARYISYQPSMYSYYGLERSPFLHREYARFCMSLPPALLRKRKLQREMLQQHWPIQAAIGGTIQPKEGFQRKWHGLRYRIADRLPPKLRPLAGVTSVFRMGSDCARHSGRDAFPGLPAVITNVGPFRGGPIEAAVKRAILGDKKDLQCVLAVEPIINAIH